MYFEIIDNKNFIIILNSSYQVINNNNKNEIIKKLLIMIKKRYSYNILGFYEVDIYNSSLMFSFIKFKKTDDSDGIYNNIDLRIKIHKTDSLIKLEDYEILKRKYIKSSIIKEDKIYKICEHYTIIKPNLHS